MPVPPARLLEKRRAVARRRVQSASQLMSLLRELKSQVDEQQGLTFEDADFADQTTGSVRLTQVDKALYDQSTGIVNTMLTAFVNNNWDDVFNALIP